MLELLFGLLTHSIKAAIPDLSDWVRANQKLLKPEHDLGRAADVMMWANAGKKIKHRGKTYQVFLEDERKYLDQIMNTLSAFGCIALRC